MTSNKYLPFDDDLDDEILEQVLKNEQLLEELGPLNKNWFEDLNDQFSNQMFGDMFSEKISTGLSQEKRGEVVAEKSSPSSTSDNACANSEAEDLKSLTQILKLEQPLSKQFVYPCNANLFNEKLQEGCAPVCRKNDAAPQKHVPVVKALNRRDFHAFEEVSKNTCARQVEKILVNNPSTPSKIKTSVESHGCHGVQQSKQAVPAEETSRNSYNLTVSNTEKTSGLVSLALSLSTVTHTCSRIQGVRSHSPILSLSKTRRSLGSCASGCRYSSSDAKQFRTVDQTRDESICHRLSHVSSTNSDTVSVSSVKCEAANLLVPSRSTVMCGFKTAGNKNLSVSKKSLQHAQTLIASVDESVEPLSGDGESNTNDQEKVPNKAFDRNSSRDDDVNNFSIDNQKCKKALSYSGFKTASSKPLLISDQAYLRAKALIASVNEPKTSSTNSHVVESANPALYSRKLTNNEKGNPTSIVAPAIKFSDSKITCCRFKTASNKDMFVSREAWQKGKNFISSDDGFDCRISSKVEPQLSSENKQTSVQSTCSAVRSASTSTPTTTVLNYSTRAKRRNNLYKPPRKRQPLQDLPSNQPPSKKCAEAPVNTDLYFFTDSSKKHLGVKHDQESQIAVSDESLLRVMALFEQV